MDLPLYLRVLWRFRVLVLAGLLLAITLAVFSYVRLSFDGRGIEAEYRQSEVYSSSAIVFITQSGFPLGRAIYDDVVPLGGDAVVPRHSEPSRFAGYSVLYAQLAMSERVLRVMLEDGPIRGVVHAEPVRDTGNAASLPFVEISGLAANPRDARATAARATSALIRYVERQQRRNGVALESRIMLQVLNQPQQPALVTPRSRTRPIFIFAASVLALLALVFVLENLRPRVRAVAAPQDPSATKIDARRRSA